MERKVKSNRKPVSLNDRHYQLLQELSSARPKASHSRGKEEDEDEDGDVQVKPPLVKVKPHGCTSSVREDSGPHFSGIADFDSPTGFADDQAEGSSDQILTKLTFCAEGRFSDRTNESPTIDTGKNNGLELTSRDKMPNGNADDKRRLGKLDSRDQESSTNILLPQNECQSVKILGMPSSESCVKPEELEKVKVKGRRRLCKLSSRENSSNVLLPQNEYHNDDISDFTSPEPCPLSDHIENDPGVGESHDILSLLSSKLGEMSIERAKRREENNDHIPSDYRSDTCTGCKDDALYSYPSRRSNINVESKENDITVVKSSGKVFGSPQVDETNIQHNRKIGEGKMVPEKLRYAGRSFTSGWISEPETSGDCYKVNGKGTVKGNNRCKDSSCTLIADPVDDTVNSTLIEEGHFTLRSQGSKFELPEKIAKFLYPHQREGVKWLWSLRCLRKGGILGDDMGLGKTMQICAFLAGMFHSKLIKRALVVAPKTLLSHWMKELSIVDLSGNTREYYGTSTKARQYELDYILKNTGVLLTTYDIIRNNAKSLKRNDTFETEDNEEEFSWDYIILDEGHLIKNPSTQRAKSLLEIPCGHRIVISGTPIQNNLKELWALFNFCCPGLLGDNKWFKENYEHFILRGNEKNASDREKRIGSAVAKDLRDRIQPYFLRRLKSDVFKQDDATEAKLSKKNELIVWLRLSSCQRQLYEAFLQSEIVLSAFDGSPLAALTILKKICDHPLLLTKRAAEDVLEGMLSDEDASLAEKLAMHIAETAERNSFDEKLDSISCKISFILSLLGKLVPEGHKILIFSQTRKMLNIIQESLLSNGYKFMRIDGTTKADDRTKIVNNFQEGHGAPIFLLTSQVGGLGLTLTSADRVIVVDPAWNPSTDNQSVDRAYRIGQKKDVIVYRLMTCGTVEEKIYRKQIFKGGLFKSATEHNEQIRYFSQQDLRELFSLPKHGFDISMTQKQLHEEHDKQHIMDDSLLRHIEFLETQGIAGVSHHSLLFSRTEPVQAMTEEEAEDLRMRNASSARSFPSKSYVEAPVDGSKYAFNPKDSMWNKKMSSPDPDGKLTESEIKAKIDRISHILGNEITVARLPDRGAKLVKQIEELLIELKKIRPDNPVAKETIDADGLTDDLGRVLRM